MSDDGKRADGPPDGDEPTADQPAAEPPAAEPPLAEPAAEPPLAEPPLAEQEQSLRGSVELPRVVLGSEEAPRKAPKRRVLPGLVDVRWLSYPAYVACFMGGGIAVNFAIDGQEWAAPPIAIAWTALFFWEWIYGVAYRYRRPVLKYFSLLLVVGLSAALAVFCWDRAEPQLVANAQGFLNGGLTERGHVDGLDWAAVLAIVSSALISLHAIILGRGWRDTGGHSAERAYRDDKHRDTKKTPQPNSDGLRPDGDFPQSHPVDRQ